MMPSLLQLSSAIEHHGRRKPRMQNDRSTSATSIGAGIYWATVLYGWAHPMQTNAFLGAFQIEPQAPIVSGAAAIAALIGLAFSQHLAKQSGLKVFAFVTLGMNFCCLLVYTASLFFGIAAEIMWLYFIMNGVSGACLMLFWGLCFASLDKKTAERCVLTAALVCGMLFFALAIPPASNLVQALTMTAKTITPLLYFLPGFSVQVTERTFRPINKQTMIGFFSIRAGIGLTLGLLTGASSAAAMHFPTENAVGMICLALLFFCFMQYYSRKNHGNMALLAITPFAISGACLLGIFDHTDRSGQVAQWSLISIWLSWIALSSVQISEYKEEFGMDEATLSFSEKATVSVFWLVGSLCTYALQSSAGYPWVSSSQSALTMISITLFWILVTIYFFIRLAGTKERGRMIERTFSAPEEQIHETCALISDKYGLSARETEILELLAKGHTRSYICEHFVLSAGTVKSHTTHIYQKLHIHNRESLFKLYEEYRVELARQKRFGVADHLCSEAPPVEETSSPGQSRHKPPI